MIYYVMKYADQYYAPYQSLDSFNSSPRDAQAKVLSSDRALAIRFGDLEIAKFIHALELRVQTFNPTFDPKKCRIVKVTSKKSSKSAN